MSPTNPSDIKDKSGEEYDSVGHAKVGTRIVFQCIDSKSKIAERECLSDGTWSAQSAAIKDRLINHTLVF